MIRTRSGNEIIFNDEDGSLKITDSGNSSIFMDGTGNIDLKASKQIKMTAQDIKFSSRHNLSGVAGNKVSLNANPGDGGGDGQIIISAENDLNLESRKASSSLISKDKAVINSKAIDIKASEKLNLNGGKLADLVASLIKINS